LSGIAGLLESDVYRTSPRIFDPYANSSSSSSLSTISTSSSGKRRRKKKKRKPLDVKQLPNTRGIRGTEKLIEALFNPTPVTRPTLVTPFTYLAGVDVQEQTHSREGNAEDGYVCVDDEGRPDESAYADSADLNHISESRRDSESDYQSVPSKWSGSLRATSIKSTRSVNRLGANELGVSTAVLATTSVGGRAWWRKVLRPGAAL
jgi:hypothetical protein